MSTLYRISMTKSEYDAYIAVPTNIIPSNYEVFITNSPVGAPNLYTGTGTNTPTSGTSGGGAGGFNNFTATTAPTASDDSSDGYTVGSRWVDITNDESYICLDATLNNALWSKTTVGTVAEIAGLQGFLDAKADNTDLTDGSIQALLDTLRADSVHFLASASSVDTLTTTGWYNIQNATGGPAGGGWYYYFHGTHRNTATGAPDTNYGFQLAKRLDSSTTNNLLMRIKTTGTWSAWATIAVSTDIIALSSTNPVMDGTAAVGTGTTSARTDHVHPSDTSRAGTAVATTSANGLMASADKTKLDGVAAGAEVNVQADWTQATSTADSFIANKPTIPTVNNTLTSTSTSEALSAAQGKALQDGKQATLVSGTNIKTLNSQNVLGAGNLLVGASTASVTTNGDGTGGTVAQVGNDRVHTFTANGNFVVPTGISAVRVLVIAGGGGGGSGRYRGDVAGRPGGGGGAGGLIHNTSFAVTPGATIAVTVGTGGAGATDTSDADAGTGGLVGGNSTFGTLTAHGGGGGGGHHETNGNPWDVPADQGGSGGGASNGSSGATQSAAASAAGNVGFSGGNGVLVGNNSAGGGGGGAGGAGGNGNGTTGAAGAGGIGLANDITGMSVTYAIGGAGSHVISTGHAGANATAIGGGGEGSYDGGSGGTASALAAGAGASGIVIVRYLYQSLDTPIYANNAAAITGGLTLGMLYRTGADPDTLCVVH